jgi:hypothetical protein
MSSAVPSMRGSADQAAPSRSQSTNKRPAARQEVQSSSDLLLYVVLTVLIFLAWQVSRLPQLAVGTDLSYWVGVTGAVMMLLLFTYPLRKHFRIFHRWGKVKWWFLVHMCLGVMGPMLILVHSTFKIGSLNAGVALISMLIVAGSGVVGRFIRVRVHRGLHGERTTLRELQARAGLDKKEARSRLSFAPEVESMMQAFEFRELDAEPTALTSLRQVCFLPIQKYLMYGECAKALRDPLERIGRHRDWTSREIAERERLALKLVRRYLDGVVRIAQFSAYERVFALWHVAHVPFVYLLVASTLVHIIAVHAY